MLKYNLTFVCSRMCAFAIYDVFEMFTQVTRLNELKSCKGSAFWMAPEVSGVL